MRLCILIYLAWNAWIDIRRREVSLPLIGILSIVGLLSWFWKTGDWIGTFVILAINALLIGFSILSKGAIGMGDALLLTAAGITMSMEEYMLMLCLGLTFASVWSLYLLFVKKKGKQTEIPLVPFFLFGYVGGLWIC